jgi:hypothetical protein
MASPSDAVAQAKREFSEAKTDANIVSQQRPTKTGGKTGMVILPVVGWGTSTLICATIFNAILFWDTFIQPHWPWDDWWKVLILWVSTNLVWTFVLLFFAFTRQIDAGFWLEEGESGGWPMSLPVDLGGYTRIYDVTYIPEFQAAFKRMNPTAIATFLLRVTRRLWKRGGVFGWPGYDGGKERGYSMPIERIEMSTDGGHAWTTIYFHPKLKLGRRVIYLQTFDEKRMDKVDQELANFIYAQDEQDWRPDSPIGYAEAVWWKIEDLGFVFAPQGFPPTLLAEKNHYEEAYKLQVDVSQDLRRKLARRKKTEGFGGL